MVYSTKIEHHFVYSIKTKLHWLFFSIAHYHFKFSKPSLFQFQCCYWRLTGCLFQPYFNFLLIDFQCSCFFCKWKQIPPYISHPLFVPQHQSYWRQYIFLILILWNPFSKNVTNSFIFVDLKGLNKKITFWSGSCFMLHTSCFFLVRAN